MVGFIHDDGPKIVLRELRQPLFSHECLNGPDNYAVPAGETALLSLFRGRQQSCRLGQLIGRLIQELPTVSQDKRPVTLFYSFFNNFAEYDGLAWLAAPRWQNQQGAFNAFFPFIQYGCFRLFLIWTKLHK